MTGKERAVAIAYESHDQLPTILAHGKGEKAKEIVRIALESNIPITENSDLLSILSEERSREGEAIPERAFGLVAEILAFLYVAEKEFTP